jgi:hypothetical protein
VAVCLELTKGPLVYALQKYDFLVLFPVNPATLAKYREAFAPSHAKDDPTDVEYQFELLVLHRDKLKALNPQSAPMRTLESLVEQRRWMVNDKNRITNRVTGALKQYYRQVVQWFDAKDTVLFCDFLSRWPTLKQVKHARRATLEAFFREHNARSAKLVEERLAAIKSATPLTEDVAVITPHQLLAQALVDQLRVTLQAIERFDAEISTSAGHCPISRCSATSQALALPSRPGCSRPSVNNASAMTAPQRSRNTPALRRSLNAAANSTGSTGDCNVLHSCVRPSSNGRQRQLRAPSGLALTVGSRGPRAARTRSPSAA